MWTKLRGFFTSNGVLIIIAIVVIGISFGSGVYTGLYHRPEIEKVKDVTNKDNIVSAEADFEPFWKVWNVLNEKFVSTKKSKGDISAQDRVWGAAEGLAASLGDPYTVFLPPVESEFFQTEISGNFEGIGAEVGMKDNILTIIAPLKDNPAYKAGILAGDKILKIDDTLTSDLSIDEAIRKMRGKKGTPVKLTILREKKKEPFEVTIIRDTIAIPNVETEKRTDGVFVIGLRSFSAVSPDLFRNALKEFVLANTDKLVLDLRGNPGGYLEAAVDMASWFLPEGKIIVRESFGPNKEETVYRSKKGYNIFTDKIKFVILVDVGSASASEILAGALQEHGVAKLVGTQTYGKGSVQELVPITKDTNLKVTIAQWLTPNGISISDGGVKPDVEVKLSPEDIDAKNDLQKKKAIELVKSL